jgi:hypothetical protein
VGAFRAAAFALTPALSRTRERENDRAELVPALVVQARRVAATGSQLVLSFHKFGGTTPGSGHPLEAAVGPHLRSTAEPTCH